MADVFNNRVQKFTSQGEFIARWGSLGSGDGQFDKPVGVAVDEAGNVYVADRNNHRIQHLHSTGTFIARRGPPSSLRSAHAANADNYLIKKASFASTPIN